MWISTNGQVALTHNSPWRIEVAGGGTLELGEDFAEGDFGINLRELKAGHEYEATASTLIETTEGTTDGSALADLIQGMLSAL